MTRSLCYCNIKIQQFINKVMSKPWTLFTKLQLTWKTPYLLRNTIKILYSLRSNNLKATPLNGKLTNPIMIIFPNSLNNFTSNKKKHITQTWNLINYGCSLKIIMLHNYLACPESLIHKPSACSESIKQIVFSNCLHIMAQFVDHSVHWKN